MWMEEDREAGKNWEHLSQHRNLSIFLISIYSRALSRLELNSTYGNGETNSIIILYFSCYLSHASFVFLFVLSFIVSYRITKHTNKSNAVFLARISLSRIFLSLSALPSLPKICPHHATVPYHANKPIHIPATQIISHCLLCCRCATFTAMALFRNK